MNEIKNLLVWIEWIEPRWKISLLHSVRAESRAIESQNLSQTLVEESIYTECKFMWSNLDKANYIGQKVRKGIDFQVPISFIINWMSYKNVEIK